MKKRNKIWLGLIFLLVVGILVFGNLKNLSFNAESAPALDLNAEGFYQYSGSTILFPINMKYGNYIISSESLIKTINHNYKFVIADVQLVRSSSSYPNYCSASNPNYIANVYDNGQLIDTLSFADKIVVNSAGYPILPTTCSSAPNTKVIKEYPEVKVTFNELSIAQSCGTGCREAQMVSKYELNYPSDTVTFSISSVDNDKVILEVNSKGNYLADISLNTKNFLGNLNVLITKQVNLNNGKNLVTLELSGNKEGLKIVPIAKLYASSVNINNLNGVKIWKDPITTVTNSFVTNEPIVSGYAYYDIGEFQGTEQTISLTPPVEPIPPQPKGFIGLLQQINEWIANFFKKIFGLSIIGEIKVQPNTQHTYKIDMSVSPIVSTGSFRTWQWGSWGITDSSNKIIKESVPKPINGTYLESITIITPANIGDYAIIGIIEEVNATWDRNFGKWIYSNNTIINKEAINLKNEYSITEPLIPSPSGLSKLFQSIIDFFRNLWSSIFR